MNGYNITNMPRVANQGNKGACQSYATAILCEYFLHRAGINEQTDPDKLFEEIERGGAARLTKTLRYGKEIGIPVLSGKRYKIKEYGIIKKDVLSIMDGLNKYQALLATYHLCNENFEKRINGDHTLERPPNDLHALILTGYDFDAKLFKFQNSWGQNWQDNGCFYLPYTLSRSRYLASLYYIKI